MFVLKYTRIISSGLLVVLKLILFVTEDTTLHACCCLQQVFNLMGREGTPTIASPPPTGLKGFKVYPLYVLANYQN